MRQHQVIAAMAGEGLDCQTIAEEVDRPYGHVAACASRYGIRITPKDAQSIRARVATMRPTEAVDMLLNIVEAAAAMAGDAHPVDDLFPKATAMANRLLRALYDAQGRYLSASHLEDYLCADGARDHVEMRSLVKRTRRLIAGSGWRIVTRYGIGYRLERVAL